MERLRSERLRSCGRLIQKMVRGWLARQHYLKLQRTARLIQTFGRGLMARRLVNRVQLNCVHCAVYVIFSDCVAVVILDWLWMLLTLKNSLKSVFNISTNLSWLFTTAAAAHPNKTAPFFHILYMWHGWATHMTCSEPYITSIRGLPKD